MDKEYIPMIFEGLMNIEERQEELDWKKFKEGIEIYPIYEEKDNGMSAALLRYRQGASAPMHIHRGFEHILVLSGSQTDGTRIYTKGMLIISDPGSSHAIVSETGCIVLAIWQKPVDFNIKKQ